MESRRSFGWHQLPDFYVFLSRQRFSLYQPDQRGSVFGSQLRCGEGTNDGSGKARFDSFSDDYGRSVSPCAGSLVQFTATPTNGGSNPLYQWKVDGVNQGVPTTFPTFDYIFTGRTTAYAATISVEVMSSCAVTASAQMILTIHPTTPVLASLLTSNPTSCAEVPVVFEVNPSSTESSYAWKIDGVAQGNGINLSTISHAFPKKAQAYTAKVSVEITHPSRSCAGKTTLELPMTVLPNPVVTCVFPEIVEAKSIHVNQVLVTGGQPPYRYQWTFGSDRVVNGKDTVIYSYANEGTSTVEVSVTDSRGCQTVCRSTQKVICPLIFPNVFTPNGDTYNDTFTILYEGNDFSMHIYNRWGRLVAETVNGLYGKGFPTGLYYYQITIASKEYKGWVSLLR